MHHRPGLARVREVEEDAEDVQRQQRDDDSLDESGDDRAELDEPLAQDPAGHHRQADTEDEGQQQSRHDLHRRRHLDTEVRLQRAARLLDVGQGRAREKIGQERGAHAVSEEAGEERRRVSDGGSDSEPPSRAPAEVGDGRSHQTDDDQRDGEGQELAEQAREGGEDAADGLRDERTSTDPGAAQDESENDRGEHPHEDAAG